MNFEQWPKDQGKKIHESEFENPIIQPQAEKALKTAREEVLGILQKNRAEKADSDHVEKIFTDVANIISSMSYDQRFAAFEVKVVNKERVRYEMKKLINNMIETGSPEEMQRFARVFMDVNGLKPINDFASHENGDKFLLRAVTILTSNERIQKFASKNNLTIMPSSEGGDEFGYWLEKNDGPITSDLINNLGDVVKAEIANMDTADIFNVEDLNVKNKLSAENLQPPSGFKFKPSISFGGLNLLQAYAGMKEAQDTSSFATRTEVINVWMDYYFKMSEGIADLDKAAKKQALKESNNEHDNFLYKIMQRSVEAREALDTLSEIRYKFIEFKQASDKLIDEILVRKSEILNELLNHDTTSERKKMLNSEVDVINKLEKELLKFFGEFDLFN